MALGILSTISATSLQRRVSALNDATSIRLWLSVGGSTLKGGNSMLDRFYELLPLMSSVSALQVAKAPNAHLHQALMMFITGFGLYLLFSWLYHVDSPTSDQRNIFIFFVCAVGLAFVENGALQVMRAADVKVMSEQFKSTPPNSFLRPENLQKLEKTLKILQNARDNPSLSREQSDNIRDLQTTAHVQQRHNQSVDAKDGTCV